MPKSRSMLGRNLQNATLNLQFIVKDVFGNHVLFLASPLGDHHFEHSFF